MIDELVKINMLYDFYGALLAPRQREILKLYYEENLSLAEIGKDYGLTRQGIHETLKRAEAKLLEYEDKLKLWQKYIDCENLMEDFKGRFQELKDKGSPAEVHKLFQQFLKEMEVFK